MATMADPKDKLERIEESANTAAYAAQLLRVRGHSMRPEEWEAGVRDMVANLREALNLAHDIEQGMY